MVWAPFWDGNIGLWNRKNGLAGNAGLLIHYTTLCPYFKSLFHLIFQPFLPIIYQKEVMTMELKISSGAAYRNGTLSTVQKAGEQAHTEPMTSAERRQQAREDKLELSEEALAILQGASQPEEETEKSPDVKELSPADQKLKDKLNQLKSVRQMLDTVRQQSIQMTEQSEKQSKAIKEALDKMKRCAKIAKNIQKGHKVPPKDEKYLLENDPKLYMMAMALRTIKKPDNKRVKSELKNGEEEQQNEAAAGVEGTAADAAVAGDIAVDLAAATDAGAE